MKVFQSSRDAGEKSLVPVGQLFFCVDLLTFKHPLHLSKTPAEYFPASSIFSHMHPDGLPFFGVVETAWSWQ